MGARIGRRLRDRREPRPARPAASPAASGGLAVEAYGKFVQVQRVDREGLAAIRDTVATLAEAEGLLAHRDAVEIRLRGRDAAEPRR